ncbi:unnamed protein product, partial [Prorocentrum cordatum]
AGPLAASSRAAGRGGGRGAMGQIGSSPSGLGKLFTLCPHDFYEDEGFDNTYEVDEGTRAVVSRLSSVCVPAWVSSS